MARGILYSSCVQTCMLHGSETWPVRKENEVSFQQAEMRMVRQRCGIKIQDITKYMSSLPNKYLWSEALAAEQCHFLKRIFAYSNMGAITDSECPSYKYASIYRVQQNKVVP